jgi:hypothetical protein
MTETTVIAPFDQLSPSRLDGWFRCQQQWRYIYLDGIRRAPSIALAFGKAFDETANEVYGHKGLTGDTLPVQDVQSIFAGYWDKEAQHVSDWSDDGEAADRGALLDSGVGIASKWRDEIAQHVQPIAIQERVEIPAVDPRTGDAFTVLGFVDLIGEANGQRFIADAKTSKRKWSPDQAIRSLQPAIYSQGTGLSAFQFHVGVRTKTPAVQNVTIDVTDTDRDFAIKRILIARRQITHAMKTGDFLPNRQSVLCTKRHCGFWEQCVKDNGGTVVE